MKNVMVIADIKNENLGDSVIFKSLFSSLISEGFGVVYKLSNYSKSEDMLTLINYRNVFHVIRCMLRSEKIILGGGGIFQDDTSKSNMLFFLLFFCLSKALGRKVDVRSVGVTEPRYFTTRFAYLVISNFSDSISVRDSYSKNRLKKYTKSKIVIEEDLALSYEYNGCSREVKEKWSNIGEFILISVRSLVRINRYARIAEDNQRFVKEFSEALNDLRKRNVVKFVFYAFDPDKDVEMIENIIEALPHYDDVLVSDGDADEFCYLASKAKFTISMRLHGGILAYKMNAKFVMLAYNQKNFDFMNTIGRGSFCLKLNELNKLDVLID